MSAAFLLAVNPTPVWDYAQTPEDVRLLRDHIRAVTPPAPIQVVSRANVCPLPWYLRGMEVRWWTEAPRDIPLAPVVIATPELEPDLLKAMYELPPPGKRRLYVPLLEQTTWLRPGVEMRPTSEPNGSSEG